LSCSFGWETEDMVCSWLTVDDACSYFVLMESSALDLLPTKWTGRLRRSDSDLPAASMVLW
jgi:hypothetical protein